MNLLMTLTPRQCLVVPSLKFDVCSFGEAKANERTHRQAMPGSPIVHLYEQKRRTFVFLFAHNFCVRNSDHLNLLPPNVLIWEQDVKLLENIKNFC